MIHPRDLSIDDFIYDLPADKIALFPEAQRHDAKLLVYKDGVISENIFLHLDQYLPSDSLIYFNNTRVINARLKFKKPTGTIIEVFCLEPTEFEGFNNSLLQKTSCTWNCFVGGASKWKDETLELPFTNGKLYAKLIDRIADMYMVHFHWQPEELTFSEVIRSTGKVPLPPYIKREAFKSDEESYQTIFAKHEGSVAAPTASLHFTPEVVKRLKQKNIQQQFITLHVGAGTFQPVKAKQMKDHSMHAEWLELNVEMIEGLIQTKKPVIAVGTTSARTLESIYWLGVKTMLNPDIAHPELHQWDVYDSLPMDIDRDTALSALIQWMKQRNIQRLFTQSSLMIAPGYKFRIVDILITNFHQPKSTLLLLVATAIEQEWKKVYDYALTNDFRFLSYGDGSVLYITKFKV